MSKSCSALLNVTPLMDSAHVSVSLLIVAAPAGRVVRPTATPAATAAGAAFRNRRRPATVEVLVLVRMRRHCNWHSSWSSSGMLATALLPLALAIQIPTAQPPEPPAPQQQQSNAATAADDQEHKAKEPPTPEHTGIRALFGNLGEDVAKLPSMQNLYLAAIGGGLAAAVHPADQTFNAHLQAPYSAAVNNAFPPGKYLGDTPEQVVLSLSTYAVGRMFDQPKTAQPGMDLLQAQLLTEMLVEPIKFATRRERPDG